VRTRRLYRAQAFYADPRLDTVRHFQSKRARDRWAANRREGYLEEPPSDWMDDGRPGIPPAVRVDVDESLPIRFPNDGEDG
jgi:hypothetical protein